eukprot:Colp12_sorted_trinity150504_noHs@1206
MSHVAQVRSVYRRMLRARELAFANDETALAASLVRIRQGFKETMGESDAKKIQRKMKIAEDVVKQLTHNVVQAEVSETGRAKLKVRPETELGTNPKPKICGNEEPKPSESQEEFKKCGPCGCSS